MTSHRALILGLLAFFAVATAQPLERPAQTSADLGLEIGDGPVFIVPVEGTIDLVLSRYIDRALRDAAAAEASAIVLRINTFGGLVEAADRIRTALLNTDIPTVAFVDPNAASAGALISFATDRIVMAPGASIGAATAVDAGGQYASEKVQSYMRGLMRSTAEAKGHDPRIAEAMVDARIAVPGVVEEGVLLTLSYREAYDLGVAAAMLASEDEVLAALGAQEREVVHHHTTIAERVLRFFGSPVIASILMLLMLGGLYAELRTPGVGVAGLMSTFAAALFFAPHYLLGMVHGWEVVLFFLGVLLILTEVFVIPGFGVPGIAGALMVVFSLGVSLIGNIGFSFPDGGEITRAILTLAITMVLLVVLMFSLGRYLPRSPSLNRLILAPDLASDMGYTSADSLDELVGRTGLALTTLRPSGMAEIGGERVDVVSQGMFIPAGETIEVVRVRGARVEVRPVRAPSEASADTAAGMA